MRNIQFCHERFYNSDGSFKAKGGRTVVMEKITYQEFLDAVPSLKEPQFLLKVGVAECSKKDNYSRREGRKLTLERRTLRHLFVTAKSETEIQLYSGELGITFIIHKSKVTDDMNLVDIV